MGSGGKKRTKRRNDASKPCNTLAPYPQQQDLCYEGESLARLLKSIEGAMESSRVMDTALPHKIWLKQQFSIGVNDVTRALERMPPVAAIKGSSQLRSQSCVGNVIVPPVHLQAILVSSDCNPRWLIRHLTSMAISRKVPLLFVKDKKGGSVRLGELVKLKTAIALGVKAKGNTINQLIEEILHGREANCPSLTEMPGSPFPNHVSDRHE